MKSLDTPISEALLREQDNFALIFPQSIGDEPRFSLYFFRIIRRSQLRQVYDSELPAIASDDSVAFDYLGTDGLGSGDNELEVRDERPWRVLHFSFGIRPSYMRLYIRQPPSEERKAWSASLEDITTLDIGDKRDFVDGKQSPYEEPTLYGEMVIFYKLKAQVGIYNNGPMEMRPSLNMLGAGYDTLPITNDSLINRMIKGDIPCRPLTLGGLQSFTTSVPNEWGENKKVVDAETLNRLLRGGRV